jgi:hypothetical protein
MLRVLWILTLAIILITLFLVGCVVYGLFHIMVFILGTGLFFLLYLFDDLSI